MKNRQTQVVVGGAHHSQKACRPMRPKTVSSGNQEPEDVVLVSLKMER